MKKITLLAAAVLCIFMLVGCVDGTDKPAGESRDFLESGASPDVRETEDTNDAQTADCSETDTAHTEDKETESLRRRITENGCTAGVGFIGYIDSESSEETVHDFVIGSDLSEAFPFLKNCKTVLAEGAELYAVVPANKDTAVTVYPTEISDEGNYVDRKDAPIYTGAPGETVILRCNLSEIYSNVLISVSDGTNTGEFRPMLSMKDGRLATEPLCYDFSVYREIVDDESAERARKLLCGTDEVRRALDGGMKLLFTGEIQMINGKQCILFALGTDREEQFVREQLYAVTDNLIYVYSAVSDSWKILDAE